MCYLPSSRGDNRIFTRITHVQATEKEELTKRYGYPPFYENGEMYMEDNGLEIIRRKSPPKDWWARVDERTLHILREIEQLNEHQREANGYIRDNMKRSTKNSTALTYNWIAISLLAVVLGGLIKYLATGFLW